MHLFNLKRICFESDEGTFRRCGSVLNRRTSLLGNGVVGIVASSSVKG